jgi:hypothetical protein
MLDLLVSPLAKVVGVIALVLALFGAGYYKGYQKLSEYKTEQSIISEQTVKKQNIITQGIQNEYKANIARLRNTYGNRVYNSASTATNTTKGTDGASPDLLLNCAITTQQLVSLQDWLTSQIANQ